MDLRGPTILDTPVHDGPDLSVLRNDDKIDVSQFTRRLRGGEYINPKTGETISPDRARHSGAGPHGGSWWKLKNIKGEARHTLAKDGRILR